MPLRVIVADDHRILRYGLRSILESNGIEVVAEAADGREALRLAATLQPDILIVDVTMPGLNGIEVTASLGSVSPACRCIVLSMHSDAEHVHRALAAGASGYLVKGTAGSEILDAVRAAAAGRRYLSPELAQFDRAPGVSVAGPIESLSARERQVLQLVVEGHSSASIAALVNLSPKSVDTYRSRLMKKLGITDVTALVKFAVQHGLTPPS
jgi:DNA-binding NarL/FixJ family response regulator